MEFMTTNDAVKKWGISERRIRQLLQDGRIEGAVKVGNKWNIPINANKPADKRSVKLDNIVGSSLVPDSKVSLYDSHIIDTANPHVVTKAQVGLSNAEDTRDNVKNVLSATK